MNIERVLRVLNSFMILIGYRLHMLDVDQRRYRLSFWGILSYISCILIYAISTNEFFGNSSFLSLLNTVSPFLWRLTRLQAFLGVKITIFVLYELKYVNRAANGILDILPTPSLQRSKFSINEAIAYLLLFSTLLICLCFGLYIAYEMKFHLPPLDHILVALNLFLPHFAVSGALKWFTIATWLYRSELYSLATSLDDIILPLTDIKDDHTTVSVAIIAPNAATPARNHTRVHGDQVLQKIHRRIETFASNYDIFNGALQKQLIMLIGLNANCLLYGVYSVVYYETTWHVLFTPVQKRVFYATNMGIFVFIFWDYMCMCAVKYSFDSVKSKFLQSVDDTLQYPDTSIKPECRVLLKKIRQILMHQLNFKLLGTLNLNVWTIVAVNIVIAAVIAVVVMYNYLNDKIVFLTELLDTTDDA